MFLLYLRRLVLLTWEHVVAGVSCVVAWRSEIARVRLLRMGTENLLSKARHTDAMFQLSFCFAWNWGVEQGRAYRA